jgi:hypothetical protein
MGQDKSDPKILNQNYDINKGDNLLVEQYKMYLESIEKVSEKRQNANSYFLTINSGICGALGFFLSTDLSSDYKSYFWLIPISGIMLSFFWYRLVNSYGQLNKAKFKILHQIEELLPLILYKSEWQMLGEGKDKKKYLPLTNLEIRIPFLFIMIYITVFIMIFIL